MRIKGAAVRVVLSAFPPARFPGADPLAESGNSLRLSVLFCGIDEVRDHLRGETWEKAAFGGFRVCTGPQFVQCALLAVISPDFGHAKGGIDRELGKRFICRVDFYRDVRRWILLEINGAFTNNPGGTGNVEARVGLGSFPDAAALPCRRSARLEFDADFL